MELEGNARASGGYEDAPATHMMAKTCMFCGRPLVDPDSLERGVGPICASKHKVFEMVGPPDLFSLREASKTAPEDLRKIAEESLDDPKHGVSRIIHRTAHEWTQKSPELGHYVGSAMELTRALGYPGTAEGLRAVMIEGKKFNEQGKQVGKPRPKGIVVAEVNGQWEMATPYISNYAVWKSMDRALQAAGARQSSYRYYFNEDQWPYILNALVDTLGGTLGILPNDETFLVPHEAMPVPARAGEAAGAPDKEDIPPPPKAPEVEKGDTVELHDGRVMIVGGAGINSRGPWVGLVTPKDAKRSLERRGYIGLKGYNPVFVGADEVKTKVPSALEKKEVEEEIERAVSKSAADREIPSELRDYQREGVLWLNTQGSGILAFEQGLGKTIVALCAMDSPALVVVPASLRENWVRETQRWRPDLTTAKVESAKKLEGDVLQADVLVCGYDLVSNVTAQKKLQSRGIDTLVIDEAQALKELRVYAKGKPKKSPARAAAVYKLNLKAKRRFFLTGTPMINGRPYELWPLLHMVDPDKWEDQSEYWEEYCDPQVVHIPGGREILNVNGRNNLPDLRERIIGKEMLRKTKDVLPLPPKMREYRSVALSEAVAHQYRDAAHDFLDWVRRVGGPERALRASRAETIAKLTALKRLAGLGKVPIVLEEASAFLRDTGRPLIIMGHHDEGLTEIEAQLSRAGYNVGVITGKVTGAKRQKAVDGFQLGLPANKPPERRKYLDVLVCSITAAGVGLTLTRAQDMIIFERVWRPFDLVQAEDRIHRFGQENKCTITYYDAAGTIDDMLAALLAQKMATAAEVIDGVNLDEDEAQNAVMRDMFGSLVSEMASNAAGDLDMEPYASWADPDVA